MTIHRIDGTESYTWKGASWSGRVLWVPGSVTKTLVLVYKTNMQPPPSFLARSGRPEPFLVILSLEVMKQPRCGDLEICTEQVPSMPGLSIDGTYHSVLSALVRQ